MNTEQTHSIPMIRLDTSASQNFWGKPDLLPSGDRRSCFHSHMGLWLMEPQSLRDRASAVIARLATENPNDEPLCATLYAASGTDLSFGFEPQKYVAVVPVHGAITKKKSKFAETSSLETRRVIRQLAADDSVSKIVLHIDSPGGAVSGISDLADEIKSVVRQKPVVAYIEDLGASAAYWIASQCSEIVANSGAFVGSLGTYGVIYDTSGAYERQGVKVHVVSSGGVKGKGVEGSEIDADTLEDQQRIVDNITDMFKADVAGGRNFGQAKVDGLFDGRVHMAADAKRMGLIDRIGTFDSVLAGEDAPEDEEDDKPEEDEKEEGKPFAEDVPAEEEDEEDEEEEMALNLDELKADIKPIAEAVKANGCPLTLESIEAKLLASGSKAKDNVDAISHVATTAGQLSALKPIAGGFASEEKPGTGAGVPTTYEQMAAEYKKLFAEFKAKGMSTVLISQAIAEKHPELIAAMSKAAGQRNPTAGNAMKTVFAG